jgi:hypothetical protein
MELDITALAEKLLEEYGDRLVDERRVEEMTLDIKRSLRKTAKRIEERYTIEVRTYKPPPAPAEGEEPVPLSAEAETARQVIEERQPRMRRLELSGDPILELDVGEPGEQDEDANEAK